MAASSGWTSKPTYAPRAGSAGSAQLACHHESTSPSIAEAARPPLMRGSAGGMVGPEQFAEAYTSNSLTTHGLLQAPAVALAGRMRHAVGNILAGNPKLATRSNPSECVRAAGGRPGA